MVHPTLPATTKRRRSRITVRQSRALSSGSPRLIHLLDDPTRLSTPLDVLFDSSLPLILDIGFGTGEPVEIAALDHPEVGILAVDLHTPGIGDLVHRIESRGLTNIAVIEADVRALLPALTVDRLIGVRTFFPDPWPKKRHHRRRLVTDSFAADLARFVRPGGFWHLATDWPDYAEQIHRVITATGVWSGGAIPRPVDRPITRYERFASQAGRQAMDLRFERLPR